MRYASPLVPGILRRRYQRFLADVELPGGEVVIAHVPNSGSMAGCSSPGSPCWLSRATGARRRLAWTLEQVVEGGIPVGVNTSRANGLALEALRDGVLTLPGLETPWTARREVRTAGRSRLDLRLEDPVGWYWVEVKNVTWVQGGVALFPDARTARGARHLEELARLAQDGQRAALSYVVQRGDAVAVAAAGHVDSTYAAALRQAADAGVAVVAVEVAVTTEALAPGRPLPVRV